MTAGLLALTIAALFTGAAFYINFAEQPARLGLDDRALLAEWKPSYKRGFAMQATLAVAGSLAAALAWWQSGCLYWLAGAAVLFANWPFTMLVMLPTNTILQGTAPEAAGSEHRALIERWGWLHAVRTGLGALATVICFWALLVVSG